MGVTNPEAGKKIMWFLVAQAAWTAAVIAGTDLVMYGADVQAENVALGAMDQTSTEYTQAKAGLWSFDKEDVFFNNPVSGQQIGMALAGGLVARAGAAGLRAAKLG